MKSQLEDFQDITFWFLVISSFIGFGFFATGFTLVGTLFLKFSILISVLWIFSIIKIYLNEKEEEKNEFS